MKVIGIRPSSFTGDKGEVIEGVNFYMTFQLDPKDGQGYGSERIYVTKAKLEKWPYQPKIGDEVTVSYNRYGKCENIFLAK